MEKNYYYIIVESQSGKEISLEQFNIPKNENKKQLFTLQTGEEIGLETLEKMKKDKQPSKLIYSYIYFFDLSLIQKQKENKLELKNIEETIDDNNNYESMEDENKGKLEILNQIYSETEKRIQYLKSFIDSYSKNQLNALNAIKAHLKVFFANFEVFSSIKKIKKEINSFFKKYSNFKSEDSQLNDLLNNFKLNRDIFLKKYFSLKKNIIYVKNSELIKKEVNYNK
jgi:hypothetical protein